MKYGREILSWFVVICVALILYVNFWPIRVDKWHVDPDIATYPSRPNYAIMSGDNAPVFAIPPKQMETYLLQVAREYDADLLAATKLDDTTALYTFIVRSPLMNFPDMISVKLTDLGRETRFAIFSRARDGYSDLGKNRRRIAEWIGRIDQMNRDANK